MEESDNFLKPKFSQKYENFSLDFGQVFYQKFIGYAGACYFVAKIDHADIIIMLKWRFFHSV